MTWIKICGTTNLEDAQLAAEAGADALGFVFYEKSPRCIDPATVRGIVRELPEGVEKVGVFVDEPADRIAEIVEQARLTGVQITLTESSPRDAHDFRAIRECVPKLIVAYPANRLAEDDSFFITEDAKELVYAVLFDSASGAKPGGTGKTFDWQKTLTQVQAVSFIVPVIVAGGLNAGNVAEAMSLFRPFGVDVASGVEAQPGKKDAQKVRAFVAAVRDVDERERPQ
jgi:phosphoribosylanthranilate isomerase